MGAEQTKRKPNRIVSWAVNLLALLLLGLILYAGGVEAWRQILNGDWRYLLGAFVVTLLWNLLAAYRWSLIARQVIGGEEIIPFRYYYTYHQIGMLTGQVLPISVGMLAGRPGALSLSRGVPLTRSVLSVFLDKFFDLLLAVLLVIPAALYLAGVLSLLAAFVIMGAMVLAGTALLRWKYDTVTRWLGHLGSMLTRGLARLPGIGPRIGRRLPQQMERLTTLSLLPNRLAAQAFLMTLVLYGLLSIRLSFFADAVQLEVPWFVMFMGACVTQLAVLFSFTPGSIGFLEAGFAAVLGLSGLSLAEITLFVIARRTYLLVFTVLQTLLAFAWIRESPAHLFRAVLSASRHDVDSKDQTNSPNSAVT